MHTHRVRYACANAHTHTHTHRGMHTLCPHTQSGIQTHIGYTLLHNHWHIHSFPLNKSEKKTLIVCLKFCANVNGITLTTIILLSYISMY